MAQLTIKNLCKQYGDTEVLRNLNLTVPDGSFTVFVGPSGCGKSTLLRMICGLDELSSGELIIDDEIVNDVPPAKRGIAMVFQSYALYPHMTVAKNMGYALRLAKSPQTLIDERLSIAADILQIGHLLERKPRELSGGQRQRVAIGRAIVREPKIFLFDEPLSNLDATLRVDMRMEFARLKKRLGATMIYVTHDQVEAMTLADQIVVMNEGRIEQVGAPLDLYERPNNRFVAGFIGSPRMNFLPIEPQQNGLALIAQTQLKIPEVPVNARTLGVRPEHLRLAEADEQGITGEVLTTEDLGSDTFAYITVSGISHPIMIRLAGNQNVGSAECLTLALDADRLHFFDEAGTTVYAGDNMQHKVA